MLSERGSGFSSHAGLGWNPTSTAPWLRDVSKSTHLSGRPVCACEIALSPGVTARITRNNETQELFLTVVLNTSTKGSCFGGAPAKGQARTNCIARPDHSVPTPALGTGGLTDRGGAGVQTRCCPPRSFLHVAPNTHHLLPFVYFSNIFCWGRGTTGENFWAGQGML